MFVTKDFRKEEEASHALTCNTEVALVIVDDGAEFKKLGTCVRMIGQRLQIDELGGTTLGIRFTKHFGIVHGAFVNVRKMSSRWVNPSQVQVQVQVDIFFSKDKCLPECTAT